MSTSATPTMSSLGVGSGLDLESIVTAMVSAKSTTKKHKVEQQQALKEIEISGLSKLKSTLTSYQDFLKTVSSGEAVNKRSITTDFGENQTPTFSYETASDVSNSAHDIAVTQLAQGTRMRGTVDSSAITVEQGADNKTLYRLQNGGSLTFTVGSGDSASSFSVDIDANSTIDSVIKKVNSAQGNPGVSMSYVIGSDGNVRFTLDSGKTGDGNELTLSGDTGIIGMSGDGSDNIIQHAQNAKMEIDGVEISSATNTFEDQVSGIKLTAERLSEQKEDGTFVTNTLKVAEDKESFSSFASDFVSKFNSAIQTCTTLYARNTYTDGKCNYDGGDLAGDPICNTIKNQMKNAVNTFVSSNGKMLYSYGISMDKDGVLQIDSEKLNKAASENYDEFVSVFQELGDSISGKLDTYTKSRGILAQRSDSAKNMLDDYTTRLNNIDEYLSTYESMMRKKYTKLDTLLGTMSSSMSYVQSIMASATSGSGS